MDTQIGTTVRDGKQVFFAHGIGCYCESDAPEGIAACHRQRVRAQAHCRQVRGTTPNFMLREHTVIVTAADGTEEKITVYARTPKEAVRHARHQVANLSNPSVRRTYRAQRMERA